MKLTKKQLSALQRIVGREQTRYDEIQSEALAGVHPSEKHFTITDGTMVVLFMEQPDGIPVGDRTETYDKYVQDYLKDARTSLVASPPTVEDCKKIIREWRGMKNLGKPLSPKITVTAKDENGASMTSYFDAYRYLDILEAVGPYRNIYMGNSDTMRTPYPCLLVYKRCGRDEQDSVNWDEPAFLLPCRP